VSNKKKYIVLDTNIYVNFLESGFRVGSQEGIYNEAEDSKILDELLTALNENKVELLIPEIILLELERIKDEKVRELENIYTHTEKTVEELISSGKKLSDNAVVKIKSYLKELKHEEKENNTEIWKILDQIIKHKNTQIIPLNEKIFIEAYKRGIMGKKPFIIGYSARDSGFKKSLPAHSIQPDCIFIESIVAFIEGKLNFEIYFATNDGGFYTTLEKKELDSHIKKELNVTYHFRTLGELLQKAIGLKHIKKSKVEKKEIDAYPLVGKESSDEESSDVDEGYVKGEIS
jgi:hypothetical protein